MMANKTRISLDTTAQKRHEREYDIIRGMNKQMTLPVLTDELAQARTRKKEFLEQMNGLIPWEEWRGIIKPYY